MVDKTSTLACCADLYSAPWVQLLLGDSWHPGGLALTRTLAKAIKLSREDRLLDVACGRGASACMLAQVYKCGVEGIDSSAASVNHARKEAQRYRLDRLVTFREGDATRLPFPDGVFTAVLCECATTLFADKRTAFAEIARVLRPGGRLALSDVTFRPGSLPPALDHPFAQALCIPLGSGPERYRQLLQDAGFVVEECIDCSHTVVELADRVRANLGVLALLDRDGAKEAAVQVAEALTTVTQLVASSDLGYWAFLARKAGP